MNYGFDKKIISEPTLDVEARFEIIPIVSFPITAKVYGVFGPIIRPGFYLQGVVKYSYSAGLSWFLKLAFDINVGVVVGIPYVWDSSWEWKIFEWVIFNISSNTADIDYPTTTVNFYPEVNGWTGPYTYVWFNVTDNGDVPSGIKETRCWFSFLEYWFVFNYSRTLFLVDASNLPPGNYENIYTL